MDETSISAFRVLIVPGLHGSGPGHWQSRWQHLYPSFERVVQERWDVPHLPTWSARLTQVLQQSTWPTLVVAHSFGCLVSLHLARAAPNLAGALLVAPADPVKFDAAPLLLDVKPPWPSIMVGSLDDPWMEARRATAWAHIWGCEFVNAGALGHINADSGLGNWPFGLHLLRRLAEAVQTGSSVNCS